MAYFEGHSIYKTDCTNFRWKYVNYDKTVSYDSYYSGGSRLYAPHCTKLEVENMMWRPVARPCDGCQYYELGIERGPAPPGGYKI